MSHPNAFHWAPVAMLVGRRISQWNVPYVCIVNSIYLLVLALTEKWLLLTSVIFVNENENENGEKRENNEFVNEN